MILASGSPQRRAILEQLGVAFEVVVSDIDELETGEPAAVAVENARRKARAAVRSPTGAGLPAGSGPLAATGAETVLGADTVVTLAGCIYGKPADRDQARATLRALSGRSHVVISGVCVIERGTERTAWAATEVSFRALGERELEWYLDTGEWCGRAGGYAVQGRGAALVRAISGDYLNVVGLPLGVLLDLVPSLLFPAIGPQ